MHNKNNIALFSFRLAWEDDLMQWKKQNNHFALKQISVVTIVCVIGRTVSRCMELSHLFAVSLCYTIYNRVCITWNAIWLFSKKNCHSVIRHLEKNVKLSSKNGNEKSVKENWFLTNSWILRIWKVEKYFTGKKSVFILFHLLFILSFCVRAQVNVY